MKANHILAVINAAAQNGFEFDPSDTMEEIWQQAEETLLENEPMGHQFIQCVLSGHGMSQSYTFIDEDGTDITMSGEIFTFHKAKEEDDVYFEKKGDEFIPVNWFDIPDEYDSNRKNFVFVFDKVVCSDGTIAYLYDHMA